MTEIYGAFDNYWRKSINVLEDLMEDPLIAAKKEPYTPSPAPFRPTKDLSSLPLLSLSPPPPPKKYPAISKPLELKQIKSRERRFQGYGGSDLISVL